MQIRRTQAAERQARASGRRRAFRPAFPGFSEAGRAPLSAQGKRRNPDGAGRKGSVLLLVVVVSVFLSGLVVLAVSGLVLDRRGTEGLKAGIRVFYLAESGLAHGHATCRSLGEAALIKTSGSGNEGAVGVEPGPEESPFGRWIVFGDGRYRVEAYDLSLEESPYLDRDSGILLVSTGSLAENPVKRLCLLLDGPIDWKSLAWWEPE